jgi:hypothetical protein
MPLNGTNTTTIVTASQDFSESYLWAKDTFALCNLLEKGGLYHKPGTKEILETLNPVVDTPRSKDTGILLTEQVVEVATT